MHTHGDSTVLPHWEINARAPGYEATHKNVVSHQFDSAANRVPLTPHTGSPCSTDSTTVPGCGDESLFLLLVVRNDLLCV